MPDNRIMSWSSIQSPSEKRYTSTAIRLVPGFR